MKRQRLAGIEKEMARVISQAIFMDVKNPKVKGLVSVTNVSCLLYTSPSPRDA